MDADTRLADIERQLAALAQRNRRVEAEKAWETSWFRAVVIAVLTYAVVAIFLLSIGVQKGYLHALVPAIGFVFSVLSLPWIRMWWIQKRIIERPCRDCTRSIAQDRTGANDC